MLWCCNSYHAIPCSYATVGQLLPPKGLGLGDSLQLLIFFFPTSLSLFCQSLCSFFFSSFEGSPCFEGGISPFLAFLKPLYHPFHIQEADTLTYIFLIIVLFLLSEVPALEPRIFKDIKQPLLITISQTQSVMFCGLKLPCCLDTGM